MKGYENLSKKTKIGLIISIVLCVLLLINAATGTIRQINRKGFDALMKTGMSLIMSLVVLWYALVGYKKPHGNSLRFAFFVFALFVGLNGITDYMRNAHLATGIILLVAALTLAYISGRLNKIEKNKRLLVLVGLLFLADAIIRFVSTKNPNTLTKSIGYLSKMAYLIAFGFAYTARYEQHKEAGLEDSVK